MRPYDYESAAELLKDFYADVDRWLERGDQDHEDRYCFLGSLHPDQAHHAAAGKRFLIRTMLYDLQDLLPHSRQSSLLGWSEAADLFGPSERLLDTFSNPLAHHVTWVTRRPTIDCRAQGG